MGHEGLDAGSVAKRRESQRDEGDVFLSHGDYAIII